jgi:hypothetical protein
MNTVKFSLGLLAAVFFFALGIYFQSALPTPTTREPASMVATAKDAPVKIDPRVTAAFRACVDSKIKNNSISVGKLVVEGRRWSIVSIGCAGDDAKELYEAIQPYSTEEYVRYRDKRRGVVRFFGRLYPPSQCVELIGGAKGKQDYSCSIRIDVDQEITDQLRF